MTITIIPYPVTQMILLPDLLNQMQIGLDLVETKEGYWIARLVGAHIPTLFRRDGRVSPLCNFELYEDTKTLTRPTESQAAALRAAADVLTAIPGIVRDDGTDIDLREVRVTL